MFFLLRPSGVDVQTWRWDTPVITFTWEGDDRIDRNINVLLMGETEPRAVLVEANAWQDLREGKEIFRRWVHREFQRIDVEAGFPDREVREALEEAYSEVNHWTTENLTQEELLQG